VIAITGSVCRRAQETRGLASAKGMIEIIQESAAYGVAPISSGANLLKE
jgi:hypothetical protein